MQRMMDRLLEAQRQQGGRTDGAITTTPAAAPPAQAGANKRKRGRPGPGPAPATEDGLVARVRAWWAEVLKQAAKK
jgi:hypothetical protein